MRTTADQEWRDHEQADCLPGRRPRDVPLRRARRTGRVRRAGRRGRHGRRGDRGHPRHPPSVVLLDVHMPDGGGLAVLAAVAADVPDTRFLALSVSDAAEDVIAVIRAGARGYVTKTISAGELTDAVHRVAEGDVVFSPRLAGFVLDAFRGGPVAPSVDPELDQLTPREREVHATAGPRLRLQGDRRRAVHLDQDGRDARVERAAQVAAVEPASADPLGRRSP